MPVFLCDDFAEGPDYAPEPRDTVVLNGKRMPGIASVRATPKNIIDKKKPHGGDGIRAVERGYDAGSVLIAITFWTQPQETILWSLIDEIWRPPGKSPREERAKKPPDKPGILIDHPNTARLKIDKILIESIDAPEPAKETGAWVLKISAIQYFEPKGDQTRLVKGAGHTLTPRAQGVKNAVNLDPSKTDAVPKLRPKPASGSR